jgi:hypothetical protein
MSGAIAVEKTNDAMLIERAEGEREPETNIVGPGTVAGDPEEDLYGRLKMLQRQLEFVEIQV